MKQAGQGGIHRHSRRSQEDVDDMMEFNNNKAVVRIISE
jgi:hypothetical protein